MKYFASSNLITDLKFKQQVGVKADAHIEALAIINKNEGENDENVDLKIQLENRDELQINAKLFVKSFDIDLCLEAVKCLKQAFEVEKIDSLTFSVPAEGIESIGIGAHSVNEDTEEFAEPKTDPERQEFSQKMLNLWSSLTEKLQNEVNTFGLCDLETDVFFQLFEESTIKPKSFQVNLKSCCVVPPKLQEFSKEKGVKLHTHADSISVLGQEFIDEIKTRDKPNWIIRCQLFVKARGVLQDKRYLIQYRKD